MTGALFLRLNERFALGADDLQWILYRASRRDPDMTNSHHWHGVSFVRATKDMLLRCMREKGCKPSDEAQSRPRGYGPLPLTPGKRPCRAEKRSWSRLRGAKKKVNRVRPAQGKMASKQSLRRPESLVNS
jgi:hypothetical protein